LPLSDVLRVQNGMETGIESDAIIGPELGLSGVVVRGCSGCMNLWYLGLVALLHGLN